MIDCENEVFTRVAAMLRSTFPGISVAGEYINAPSAFPHVSIVMSDNSVVFSCLDSGDNEVDLALFEINIYSNKTTGRKTECRKIARAIDGLLCRMNFRRMSMIPVPNVANAAIYRITARYRVATDGKYFYRR